MKLALFILIGLSIFSVLLYSYAGNPFKKMVLNSEMSGEVYLNGMPLIKASINREVKWTWGNETILDSTITDDKGKFTLPIVLRRSISGRLLPHEPVIRQTITAHHEGNSYNLWMYDKRGYDDLDEFNGQKIILDCVLEKQAIRDEEFESYGICRIKKIP